MLIIGFFCFYNELFLIWKFSYKLNSFFLVWAHFGYFKTGNKLRIHGVEIVIHDQIEFLVSASIHDWCLHKHMKLSQKQRCRDTNSIMDMVCIASVRSLKADIEISWFTSAAYEITWSLIYFQHYRREKLREVFTVQVHGTTTPRNMQLIKDMGYNGRKCRNGSFWALSSYLQKHALYYDYICDATREIDFVSLILQQ